MATEESRMDSLIKVVEVWQPDEAGDRLCLGGGIYGNLDEFCAASQHVTFELGEALPGYVWQKRSPLILNDLYQSAFKRTDAARQAGLTSALAIPLIDGDALRAVVLLMCDDSEGAQGAFEVWSRDERSELGLSSDYYANLKRLSNISHFVKFPRGAGVPGAVWDRQFPSVIEGLSASNGFARAAGMGADGLNIAVGLPVMRDSHDLEAVVLILSSRTTPMAKVFEVWAPSDDQSCLRFHHGAYGERNELGCASYEQEYEPGEGLVGKVWSTRVPIVTENVSAIDAPRSEKLKDAGLSQALAMPVFAGDQLSAVVVMLN